MKNFKILVCAGVLATMGLNAMGVTLYDNSPSYNGTLMQMQNGLQVGNEITFHPGNLWNLTHFGFEYYTSQAANFNPLLGVDVRFYAQTGPTSGGYPTPAPTPFWDSGWYYNTLLNNIPSGVGAHEINYTAADLYGGSLNGSVNMAPTFLMPAEFTFTITFTNVGSDIIDLALAANQTTGQSSGFATTYGNYWRNTAGSWSLLTNSVAPNAGPANFVAIFEGVPEPSVLGLGAMGGALLLGVNKLRRKR
jgi:hypothetical protein